MSNIKFGRKFNGWDEAQQLDYLKKLASSQNEALDQMQKERDSLLAKVMELESALLNAEQAMMIQKNINRASMLKQNEDGQEAGKRIQELQAMLRSKDHGDQHHLGD